MLDYQQTRIVIKHSRHDNLLDEDDVDYARKIVDRIESLQIKDLSIHLDQIVIHKMVERLIEVKRVDIKSKKKYREPPFLRIESNFEENISFYLDEMEMVHIASDKTEDFDSILSRTQNQFILFLSNLISSDVIKPEISIEFILRFELIDIDIKKFKDYFNFEISFNDPKTVSTAITFETIYEDTNNNIKIKTENFDKNQTKVDILTDVKYRNKFDNIADINLINIYHKLHEIVKDIGGKLNVQ